MPELYTEILSPMPLVSTCIYLLLILVAIMCFAVHVRSTIRQMSSYRQFIFCTASFINTCTSSLDVNFRQDINFE